MNISKAITVLEDIIHYVEPGDPPEEHQAAQLGIEALKRIQLARNGIIWRPGELLVKETPEDTAPVSQDNDAGISHSRRSVA